MPEKGAKDKNGNDITMSFYADKEKTTLDEQIGILRSIGASKKNISSIFNAETFIVGLLSGLFGIGITYILIPIIAQQDFQFI